MEFSEEISLENFLYLFLVAMERLGLSGNARGPFIKM